MTQLIFYAGTDAYTKELLSKEGTVLEGKNKLELLADADVCVTDATTPRTETGFWLSQVTCTRNIPLLALNKPSEDVETAYKHPLLTRATGTLEENVRNFFTAHPPKWRMFEQYMVCDAIDGAGKGEIVRAAKTWGESKALQIFDCTHYSNYANHIPTWEDVQVLSPGCNMLIIQEPSFSWLGKIIREEIIAKDSPRKYSAISAAMAYALDRELIFKRLVIPALEAGAIVFSDRGRITSEVYQPVQAEVLEQHDREHFLSVVRGLIGNQVEESCIPGLLMVPIIDPAVTEERRKNRRKDDNAIFETKTIQEELAKVYDSDRIKRAYSLRGTRVVDLPMAELKTPEDTRKRVAEILFQFEAYIDSRRKVFFGRSNSGL